MTCERVLADVAIIDLAGGSISHENAWKRKETGGVLVVSLNLILHSDLLCLN